MSEEQQLQKTTGWASPFLEPAETIRAAAWEPSSELGYLRGSARLTGWPRLAAWLPARCDVLPLARPNPDAVSTHVTHEEF
jgi:hypothetical protein